MLKTKSNITTYKVWNVDGRVRAKINNTGNREIIEIIFLKGN